MPDLILSVAAEPFSLLETSGKQHIGRMEESRDDYPMPRATDEAERYNQPPHGQLRTLTLNLIGSKFKEIFGQGSVFHHLQDFESKSRSQELTSLGPGTSTTTCIPLSLNV